MTLEQQACKNRIQKTLDNKELVELCMHTGEDYPGFTVFNYFQIVDATDNFSEKRYLGSGGFATAYTDQLPHGLVVGIKRFDHRAMLSDFSNELQLARLRHTNVTSQNKRAITRLV